MQDQTLTPNKAVKAFQKKKQPLRPQVSIRGDNYDALFNRVQMQGLKLSLLVDTLVNHELDRLELMCED